jgi:predicted MFS family arabinose efflux permease
MIYRFVADRCSREDSIRLASMIFIIGFAFQTVSMDYAMLVVGRLISGIAVGMLAVITPLYISEISPPEIRGSLLVFSKSFPFSRTIPRGWVLSSSPYELNV